MSYKSYIQVIKDINYADQFSSDRSRFSRYNDPREEVSIRDIKQVKSIWNKHIKEEYESTKNSNTALEEVVVGVEDSKKNGGNLKVALNATESLATRRKVAKILNKT